jgi:hypothetical protein
VAAGAVALCGADIAFGDAIFHQPDDSAYLGMGDSPWAGISNQWNYFYLEDFEDGALNTPGAIASDGVIRGPGGSTDSVDIDDGTIDGMGVAGSSFFLQDPLGASITFTFDINELGALPTAAGIVWTDGNALATVTFEAYNAQGVSIGSFDVDDLGDGNHNGSTAADRFLGVEFLEGISAITISASIGSIEVDHFQYGAIPAPAVLALLAGFGLVSQRRRRK